MAPLGITRNGIDPTAVLFLKKPEPAGAEFLAGDFLVIGAACECQTGGPLYLAVHVERRSMVPTKLFRAAEWNFLGD